VIVPKLESAPDYELLRLATSSDAAFAVFYRRYEKLVVGWLVRRCERADLAAELTAEVFAAAYLAAPRYREGSGSAAPWLLGIARHKLLRSLRRDRTDLSARRKLAVERIEFSDTAVAAVEELRNCGLLELLDGLPTEQAEAVRGRIVDEADYPELARELAISPAAARKRVSRGLASLRKILQEEGESA
jgi:RNA polymerase sigma factor (sigma-70 family)